MPSAESNARLDRIINSIDTSASAMPSPPLRAPNQRVSAHRSASSSPELLTSPRLSQQDAVRQLSRNMSTQMSQRAMRRLEHRRGLEETHFLVSKQRALNLNPPVDMRLLDYVSKYDENLMCPICRCPFVDPVVLNECDHIFCRDCIRQCWTAYTPLGPRGDCPTCRTSAKLGPRTAVSKILVNMCEDLVVKCPKSEDGCTAEVKRGEVQDHVTIYCGYAQIECPDEDCDLPVRRKDSVEGCLHYGVSCMDCHENMPKAQLESHWRNECADRKVTCNLCEGEIFFRERKDHQNKTCPAITVPCPGAAIGCIFRSKRGALETHAKNCTLATLAPVLQKQKERLDEQEAAQRELSRKLEVLEGGFASMQHIMYGRTDGNAEADESRIPLLSAYNRLQSTTTLDESRPDTSASDFHFPVPPSGRPTPSPAPAAAPSRAAPLPPAPRPSDLPEPYTTDFDLPLPFPAASGPYASPLHHLLSMHENLRDELSRTSSALAELDGRHSMQILNENLRTREEISYLGAQVAGVSRQVHWLTSAQLQRQQGRSQEAAAGGNSDIAGAGAGVEAAVSAVNTAATALRGAARVVGVGREGMGMRRGPSEEGRTKL